MIYDLYCFAKYVPTRHHSRQEKNLWSLKTNEIWQTTMKVRYPKTCFGNLSNMICCNEYDVALKNRNEIGIHLRTQSTCTGEVKRTMNNHLKDRERTASTRGQRRWRWEHAEVGLMLCIWRSEKLEISDKYRPTVHNNLAFKSRCVLEAEDVCFTRWTEMNKKPRLIYQAKPLHQEYEFTKIRYNIHSQVIPVKLQRSSFQFESSLQYSKTIGRNTIADLYARYCAQWRRHRERDT